MQQLKEILSPQVAWRIGFSDGLSPSAWNAYQDIKKWPFHHHLAPRLHQAYYRGWRSGWQAVREVKQLNLSINNQSNQKHKI